MTHPVVEQVLRRYDHEPSRLMDILIDIQEHVGYLSDETIEHIGNRLNLSTVDVEQTVSFYHFFAKRPRGTYTVYLNTSAVAVMKGRERIAEAFEREAGCRFGEVSEDGLIGLFDTPCIGMNDQEPAALINNVVFPNLTTFRVRELVRDMRQGVSVEDMRDQSLGDGMNNSTYLKATVNNNIRKKGAVIFSEYEPGAVVRKIVENGVTPQDIIDTVKQAGIRGRGGAGFPTGLKWDFCRKVDSDRRFIFCNADEGEPGTFKDRVILTELPHLIFDGMVLAGYAVDAREGILYLRYEYRYLRDYLEHVLSEMRNAGTLGKDIGGRKGFDFDIRIQFGAGAYVCGEESGLIESAEGKRGEPRDRPPFPVERGYLDKPTVVNNVETLCQAAKVFTKGVDWYRRLGTSESTGTKVLSVSGDCRYPGVYEVEWGFNVNDIIEMVGAEGEDIQAVQVGGPSGSCIAQNEFDRILGYEDLSTGGSIIIIGTEHDLLRDVVLNFTEFFMDESCGSCSTCRALTAMYVRTLRTILEERGRRSDLEAMLRWADISAVSRCGLGQTAANPIVTTIRNFRYLYEARIRNANELFRSFDLSAAVQEACKTVGRSVNV
ncbi:MAG: NAD(P)H-dependent oxidoreductase subunit E [Spirochaetaceae bacterium]